MSKEPLSTEETSQEKVHQIIEAARLLGVEVDETDVAQWLTAMAAGAAPGQSWQVDARSGVFGHQITLLDFDPTSLAYYRRIADIVQLPDRPNVETAVALSGSAAQGRVQPYPGDYDFFERVNIIADTREEACRILGEMMREKALAFFKGPEYELIEVKFGTWQVNVLREGELFPAGHFISWSPEEVQAGQMEVSLPNGEPLTIPWSYGEKEPGWCKMDWVVVLPDRGIAASASNMLDVTWQTPEGELLPLDGFLDPYFQEVYLESSSIPLFAKLAGHLSPQVVQEYVRQLEHEVYKYTHHDPPNFGKATKRLYNIFRLTGRHREAALIRELFDEPTARLYQVWALLDTLDDARRSTALSREAMIQQTDRLIRQVVETAEGPQESDLVMALLRLRDDLSGRHDLTDEEWAALVEKSRHEVLFLVNHFFEAKLMDLAEVRAYIEALGE